MPREQNGGIVQSRAWLHSLCHADHPKLRTPFAADWEGERHDCASNGQAIVLVRGPTVFSARDDALPLDVALVQTEPVTHARIPFATLRDWMFDPTVCANCNGSGWVVGYDDDDEDAPCDCSAGFQSMTPGRVFGRWINRRLGWDYLSLMLAETVDVTVAGPREPVRFTGPDWRVYVMPLRSDMEHSGPELSDWLEQL